MRRLVAGILLVSAAAGPLLLARAAERAAARSAPPRTLPPLPASGAPHLIVVVQEGCPACRRVLDDVEVERRLRRAGVEYRVHRRGSDAALPPGWERGRVPLWHVVGEDGERIATRQGAAPPEHILLWVQDQLTRPRGPPSFP